MADTILYMTDRFGVSTGYERAFSEMLLRAGIRRNNVIVTNIYNIVRDPLYKKANEKIWRFNPEKLPEIKAAFDQRIATIRPKMIVCSDAAVLGVLVNGDSSTGTIDKCRGGVYHYKGIPCVVTYPITVIHSHVDESLLRDHSGDDIKEEPYRIPSGAWILNRDWQKVGRYYHGKQRRLPQFSYSICRTLDDVVAAKRFLTSCVAIALDSETALYPPQVTCIGYTGLAADGRVHTYVIPFYDPAGSEGAFWEDADEHAMVHNLVGDIHNCDAVKILQNGSYDSAYFIRDRIPMKNYLYDTMLLWFSIYMELPKSLDFISSILLDEYQYWKDDIKGIEDKDQTGMGMEKYWRYCGLDTFYTLFNCLPLLKILSQSSEMQTNYNDVFMRMLSGMRMSMRGLRVDYARMHYHRENLQRDYEAGEKRVRFLVGDDEFNINSSEQKQSLLYDVFGLRERNARGRFVDRSKPLKGTNAPSAGAIPLKMAKTEHPIFKYIIEALEEAMVPSKQISNVFGTEQEDGKIKGGFFMPTRRFRTAFSAAGTDTTRFSSKKSNFWDGGNAQNIRKEYRDFMVTDPDCIFFEVDYSQSDDVFVAYEANDPTKIKVIESGVDGHAVHGELFFGMAYDEIVKGKKAGDPMIIHPIRGVRQISKRVVHGTNFQMAALTLFMTMGRDAVAAAAELLGHHDAAFWPQERLVQVCAFMMSKYRQKYPRLTAKEWYAEIMAKLRDEKKLTNAFGITRTFLGDYKDSGTQRSATAFMGQSGTAGNMNRAMYEIDWGYVPRFFRDGENPDWLRIQQGDDYARQMDMESHGFRFALQVHDSFLIQLNTKHPKWREAVHNVLHVMERPVIINGHLVRVKTEAEFMTAWGSKSAIPCPPPAKLTNEYLDEVAATLLERN